MPSLSNLRYSWSFLIVVIVDLKWLFGFYHQDHPWVWSRQTLYIDLESDCCIWKAEKQFLSDSMVFGSIVKKALFPLQESEDRSSNLGSIN